MSTTAYINDTNTNRRARGLVLGRFAVILLFMAALLLPAWREVFNWRTAEIFTLMASLAVINCLYLLAARRSRIIRKILWLQMVIDLAAISVVVYLSGAERSSFLFLYFASIIAAGTLLSPRSSLLFASLSAISIASISIISRLPQSGEALQGAAASGAESLFHTLVIHSLGFYMVALLTMALTNRLKRIRDLNRLILEQFRSGLLVLDGGKKIIFANDAVAALLGFNDKKTLMNRRINAVFRRETDKALRDILADAPPARKEIRYNKADNETVDLEITAGTLKADSSRRGGTIAVISDRTDRKRMEQAARLAEQIHEMRRMSAGIAHEIRNPLASIRGCAQQLEKGGANKQKLTGIICRESDRLDGIIADFIDFAKMREPHKQPCDLVEILDEAADIIEARHSEKNFTLVRDYTGEAPFRCDRGQMIQMLLNLGINALQAVGEEGTIRLALERPDTPTDARQRRRSAKPHIKIIIGDDGQGISEENLSHIFTPFFSTKERGAGLGLSIVNTIAQYHDIEIQTESSPGIGTNFSLLIPTENGLSACCETPKRVSTHSPNAPEAQRPEVESAQCCG